MQAYTHTDIVNKEIVRNQVRRPLRTWFKNHNTLAVAACITACIAVFDSCCTM